MHKFILPILFSLLAGSTALAAPALKAEVSVNHPVITVGDMFEDAGLLREAKVGIFTASLISGTIGYIFLSRTLRKNVVES